MNRYLCFYDSSSGMAYVTNVAIVEAHDEAEARIQAGVIFDIASIWLDDQTVLVYDLAKLKPGWSFFT